MNVDDEILKEFLTESRDNLDLLDRELVALERDASVHPRIAGIFRAVHTIKGTAGFLGFKQLESLAHSGENLLSRLRDGRLTLTPRMTTSLLAMCDSVRQILADVEREGTESPIDCSALVAALDELTTAAPAHAPSHDEASPAPIATPEPPAPAPAPPPAQTSPTPAPTPAPAPVAAPSSASKSIALSAPAPSMMAAPKAPPAAPAAAAPAAAEGNGAQHDASVSDSSVRVDVGLLDRLMNLVGELVLARNQILQLGAQHDAIFASTSQRLNLITTELQEGVMKTRMQPIGNVLNKFPRVVRDIAQSCGKRVEIEIEGADTELDRTIIEAVRDPLTHIVRNAIDHGIETPAARVEAAKPASGRLTLRAFHEGGRVNIELRDDGAGIDPERVRQVAVRRGVISPERASRLSDREAVGLIFMPGFSTVDQVTHLSGRGVGMDVVRTNVEKIGGTVEVHSVVGQGTAIKIKIPLTLAIVPALIVNDDGERYAIPQVSLLELVRLEGAQALAGIEMLQGAPVYRLRGNLLPLVYLRTALGAAPRPRTDDDVVNIVVLQADDRPFGLVVDGVSDTGEIVVKPLGREIKGVSVFAGATIMGDGRVALILDVLGLAQRGGVMAGSRERTHTDEKVATDSAGPRRELLLFQVGDESRIGVPLSSVARLEEFGRERIERAGRRKVIQYRGEILPLIDLSEFFGHESSYKGGDALQVIVYAEGGRRVGLVVQRILDVVEDDSSFAYDAASPGLLGSTTIQGKVTDLLDVENVIRTVDPALLEKRVAMARA